MRINSILKLRIADIKKVMLLFLTFGTFKSLTYFAPIGLSKEIGSIEQFGIFEYSLNLGQALMGVFSMGLAGAYAYFIITKQRKNLNSLFHFHFLLLSLIITGLAIAYPDLLNNIYFGAITIGLIFANQIFISAVLKLSGNNNIAIVIDTGLYILLAFIVALIYFDFFSFSLEIWYTSVLALIVVTTAVYHLKNLVGLKSELSLRNVKDLYAFGGLIVVAGPLLVLITNSTRIYVEHFLSFEEVGIYSFYFRLSSIVLVFSRVLVILMFRKMFSASHKLLDKNFSNIMLLLFLVNVLTFFTFTMAFRMGYLEIESDFHKSYKLFLICFFQISFWIHTSLLEPVLQRENKMKHFIGVLVISLSILIGSLFLLQYNHLITLENIVWINALSIFLLFCGQQLILYKSKIFYKRSLYVHGGIGLLFLFTLFIL